MSNRINITDNASIFSFIKPNSNDNLSKMSGLDLQTLIALLEDYYLQLRSRLGLAQSITFGLEIEFEHTDIRIVASKINDVFHGTWRAKTDSSLYKGTEINSPILRDTDDAWESLSKVCAIIKPLGYIDTKSGGHVHLGAHFLGSNKDTWLNFIKLWSVYENIIYRFAYGSYLTGRPKILQYAEPMTKDFWRLYNKLKGENASLETTIHLLANRRSQAVNFQNVSRKEYFSDKAGNTIEFRCPNGSMDAVIWQNNVNLFAHLLLYSKSNNYNDDLISARHNINGDKYTTINWYNEIYLEQALELADMLFNNNLDKIYFLKQYLKSFQVCKHNEYVETKKLSKKGIKKII